jgi:deazaflavin-dependent oxidoreductase (nitroreductase family)
VEKLAWKAFDLFTKAHIGLYRATGGRIGHGFVRGAPVCLVEHVGRRSGKERTTPLIYGRDGDDVVIVASKGGHPRHPAWLLNLRANPRAAVQIRDERWPVLAREATEEEERERLWSLMAEIWPSYDSYQARTNRQIPIMVLERTG